MHSLILHVISKSHPLWQVQAQSHLTRHIRIPPPLATTCTVSSSTSYQNPTPSGKYMHSLILHVISKCHPLWQVHAQSHLTHHIKIPPPLASTCTVSSDTSYQNPNPSGKHMHSLILRFISESHPLWQVHAQSHLTPHIKIPPPLASTCTVSSYTSYQNPTPSSKYKHSHILHVISKSHPLWFTKHSWRSIVYGCWFTKHSLRALVYESWFTNHGLRAMVYESWFTIHSLRAMVYRSRSQPHMHPLVMTNHWSSNLCPWNASLSPHGRQ